ncbi:MAG: hypothetical protein ACXV3D_04550 [Halobacteriota archaeon]
MTDGARSTAGLKVHPGTTLARTKITATAVSAQQFIRRDITFARRLIANGAVLVKSLVYLSLFGLVSAIALIYKYLLLALIYVMARFYPARFDRGAVIEALNEVEKDSWLND